MKISKLTDQLSVAYQIDIADIEQIKQLGFGAIIANRPDGEEVGQPDMDEIAEAAKQNGLEFYYIPLANRSDISKQMIEKTSAILDNTNAPVLAFCRTGTRSAILWALAQKGKMSALDILSIAKRAGYDISFLLERLEERA